MEQFLRSAPVILFHFGDTPFACKGPTRLHACDRISAFERIFTNGFCDLSPPWCCLCVQHGAESIWAMLLDLLCVLSCFLTLLGPNGMANLPLPFQRPV